MSKKLRSYSDKDLVSFVDAILQVRDVILHENPDVLVFPIGGAVPLADCLRIADPAMASINSIYLPASSKIVDTNSVIRMWMLNYLREHHVPGERQYFLSIDEVLSGNSAYRVQSQVKRAVQDFSQEQNSLFAEPFSVGEVDYKTICLEDQRYQKQKKPMQKPYLQMRDRGLVIPVSLPNNIVTDQPKLSPLELVKIPGNRYGHRLPVFSKFSMSPEYLDFLQHFSAEVGVDLGNVSLQNPALIKYQLERYLPDSYQSLDGYMNRNGPVEE